MSELNEMMAAQMGLTKKYDYTSYSHEHNINVIPREDFYNLTQNTFNEIVKQVGKTYGPYGEPFMILDGGSFVATKDGYRTFTSLGFNHAYKHMVYKAISQIIERVNRNVGDGTTSCLLMAEEIFRNIKHLLTNKKARRQILSVLGDIETKLQSAKAINTDKDRGLIQPLTHDAMKNVIRMAANYDEDLSNILFEALDPTCNLKTDEVVKINRVIPVGNIISDGSTLTTYRIAELGGDYRTNVQSIDANAIAYFGSSKSVRVIIYDHTFTDVQWASFIDSYDNETPTMIIAPAFATTFVAQTWPDYVKRMQIGRQLGQTDGKTHVYPTKLDCTDKQLVLKDLAALLGTDIIKMGKTGLIDHDNLAGATVSIANYDCLIFHDLKHRLKDADFIDYLSKLKEEYANDKSDSLVNKTIYKNRIRDLEMDTKESILYVSSSNKIESRFILDKIDDCVEVVNSAITNGIVPNLFRYGIQRMTDIMNSYEDKSLSHDVSKMIVIAIKTMFHFIYESQNDDFDDVFGKFPVDDGIIALNKINCATELSNFCKDYKSFDVIDNAFVDMTALPTSAQYDLEVILASISIVKYLLSSTALIFDANILESVNDSGKYV